ncbi:TerD family protein, partial [Streptomyces sp. A7024]
MTAELVHGQNHPLPATRLEIRITADRPVVAGATLGDGDGTVRGTDWVAHPGAPLLPGLEVPRQAAAEHRLAVDLDALPEAVERVHVLLALPIGVGGPERFGAIAPPRAAVTDLDGVEIATFAVTGLDSESAVTALELYRRQGAWKVRAIGQGYADGLEAMLADHGLPAALQLAGEINAAVAEGIERSFSAPAPGGTDGAGWRAAAGLRGAAPGGGGATGGAGATAGATGGTTDAAGATADAAGATAAGAGGTTDAAGATTDAAGATAGGTADAAGGTAGGSVPGATDARPPGDASGAGHPGTSATAPGVGGAGADGIDYGHPRRSQHPSVPGPSGPVIPQARGPEDATLPGNPSGAGSAASDAGAPSGPVDYRHPRRRHTAPGPAASSAPGATGPGTPHNPAAPPAGPPASAPRAAGHTGPGAPGP